MKHVQYKHKNIGKSYLYWFFIPVPEWSVAGPVFSVSVAPFWTIQSKSSVRSCFQLQMLPESKSHDKGWDPDGGAASLGTTVETNSSPECL